MHSLTKASNFKRLGAAMMDFCIALIVSLLFLNFIAMPIADASVHLSEKREEYSEILFEAGLFVYIHREGELESYHYQIVADTFSSEEEKKIQKDLGKEDSNYGYAALDDAYLKITPLQYNQYLTQFYSKINKTDVYEEHKKNCSLFENGNLKNEEDFLNQRDFFDKEYQSLMSDATYLNLYEDGIIVSTYSIISTTEWLVTIISFFLSFLIFYLLIPMFTKYHGTLGKMMMNMALVHQKTGYIASRVAVFIRFLVFLILEVVASLYLFGLPLIASIILLFVLDGRSLHDLLAKTIVVDSLNQKLYKNEEEMKQDAALLKEMTTSEQISSSSEEKEQQKTEEKDENNERI